MLAYSSFSTVSLLAEIILRMTQEWTLYLWLNNINANWNEPLLVYPGSRLQLTPEAKAKASVTKLRVSVLALRQNEHANMLTGVQHKLHIYRVSISAL